ncbi:MAG: DUF3106 domain-containing protein, partial [Thermoanaerobaculia bacterium]
YAPDTPFGLFLFRIAAHKLESEPAQAPAPIAASRLSESAAARTACFRSLVAALPPRDRSSFLLARIAGVPHDIAARAVGTSELDFQQHVVAAMTTLRARLEPISREVAEFGPIDRLFTPESATEPSPDLEARIHAELEGRSPRPRSRRRWVPAVGVLAGVLLGALGWRALHRPPPLRAVEPAVRPGVPVSAGAASTSAPPTAADERPPAILAVGTGPVQLDGPPLSEAERQRAAMLYDLSFLIHVDALAELDAFFDTDVAAPQGAGPSSPATISPAPAPPESQDAQSDRFLAWRRMSRNERNRVEGLDREFRQRPPDQSQILLRRWDEVSGLSPEARTGLRRLAARIAALDARGRERLKFDMRTVAAAAKGDRARLLRSGAFGRSLTGQEAAAAEGILLSR